MPLAARPCWPTASRLPIAPALFAQFDSQTTQIVLGIRAHEFCAHRHNSCADRAARSRRAGGDQRLRHLRPRWRWTMCAWSRSFRACTTCRSASPALCMSPRAACTASIAAGTCCSRRRAERGAHRPAGPRHAYAGASETSALRPLHDDLGRRRRLCAARPLGLRQDHAAQHHLRACRSRRTARCRSTGATSRRCRRSSATSPRCSSSRSSTTP